MTDNDFVLRLTAMRETMYRISYSQLSQGCDRDDAVQETLVKAWEHRRKLRDERYMQTWVVRILINECHNIQRKQKRELPEPVTTPPYIPESISDLKNALLCLDNKLRLPIILHCIEGYHTHEIAKILGVPKGTVLWRMSKARKELRSMLDNEDFPIHTSQQEG